MYKTPKHPDTSGCFLLKEIRQKNHKSDNDGKGDGNQYHAGGDVFRYFRVLIEFKNENIRNGLNRRVEHLDNQYKPDGKEKHKPLRPRYIKMPCGKNDNVSRKQMRPKIRLSGESIGKPVPRMLE